MESKANNQSHQHLICGNCKNKYNLLENYPVNLPCGHSVCKQCYTEKLVQPQENMIKCPFQGDSDEHESLMEMPKKIMPNLPLVKQLKDFKGPNIYCHKHKDKPVELFCYDHKELLCLLCAFNHSDHKKNTKESTIFHIRDHNKLLLEGVENI